MFPRQKQLQHNVQLHVKRKTNKQENNVVACVVITHVAMTEAELLVNVKIIDLGHAMPEVGAFSSNFISSKFKLSSLLHQLLFNVDQP